MLILAYGERSLRFDKKLEMDINHTCCGEFFLNINLSKWKVKMVKIKYMNTKMC